MNRLNARIAMLWEIADAARSYFPIEGGRLAVPDREIYRKAVADQHTYCDIRDAIRTPNRRKD